MKNKNNTKQDNSNEWLQDLKNSEYERVNNEIEEASRSYDDEQRTKRYICVVDPEREMSKLTKDFKCLYRPFCKDRHIIQKSKNNKFGKISKELLNSCIKGTIPTEILEETFNMRYVCKMDNTWKKRRKLPKNFKIKKGPFLTNRVFQIPNKNKKYAKIPIEVFLKCIENSVSKKFVDENKEIEV